MGAASSPRSRDNSNQAKLVTCRGSAELALCARPERLTEGFAEQASSAYESLFSCLRSHGAKPSDLVTERVYLSDIVSQLPELLRIRGESYLASAEPGDPLPATTFVQQPPARQGQLCEIQVSATIPEPGQKRATREMKNPPAGISGKVIEIGGLHQLHIANVTGGVPGDGMSFLHQASSMFEIAERCLIQEGLSFHDVLRTWIYVRDIEADYHHLNEARTAFFADRGVDPSPASTGIQGGCHPPDRGCSLDLVAASGPGMVDARPIHSPTMNEATAYGSSFSRGTRVTLPDRTVIYISGTASIDETGDVVHVGDIEGQVDKMLTNVERLLEGQGTTFADLISAVTYLKRPEFAAPFDAVCRRRGFPEEIPNTITVADVCRPAWLCEMEAIAILP